MTMQRFDVSEIKATRTDEGFILDTPAITRCGVFPYRNADGTMRYELRHPDDVFKQDSLDSIKGKPVTALHNGLIDNTNSTGVTVGAVMSVGRQDGDNVTAEIVIHDTSMVDGGNKDLSCGYTLNLDEESGVYNGQTYTHRQRDIKYNHLAIVKAGRAGNARLNLDSIDFQEEKEIMVKYRLDNGVEYDVTPEIDAELKKLNQDVADAQTAAEKEKARADAARIINADKSSLRKARDHELYQSAGLMILAGLVDSKTGLPTWDKGELLGALASLGQANAAPEKRAEWKARGDALFVKKAA